MYDIIISGSFPQEKSCKTNICMEAIANMFKSFREPKEKRDDLFVGEYTNKNSYICLFYRDNIYKIYVTDSEGKFFTLEALSKVVKSILEKTDEKELLVGMLTTLDRDEAYEVYSLIENLSYRNKENFDIIKNSLFAICIDEYDQNMDIAKFTKQVLVSNDAHNRYFDKGISIIVGTDYNIGINYEHSGYDGSNVDNIISFLYNDMIKDNILEGFNDYSKLSPDFIRLEWDTNNEINISLENSERRHKYKVSNLCNESWIFEGFGKDEIKKLNISPDSFFQLSLQLAQYRIFNKIYSTYEALSTRGFYQCRTECIRPVTTESVEDIKAIINNEEKEKICEKLRLSSDVHRKFIGEGQLGQGIERHLLGLQEMLNIPNQEPIILEKNEDIFNDESYKILKRDVFSTSSLPGEKVDTFSFCPVIEDGVGIGYGIKSDSINISIFYWKCIEEKLSNIKSFL